MMDVNNEGTLKSKHHTFSCVFTTPDQTTAILAQSYLESAGIPSTLKGEIGNRLLRGYQSQSWIELEVPNDKVCEAQNLLVEAKFINQDSTLPFGQDNAKRIQSDPNINGRIILITLLIALVLVLLFLYTYFLNI